MKKGKKQNRKIVFRVVIAFALLALVIIIVAAVIFPASKDGAYTESGFTDEPG